METRLYIYISILTFFALLELIIPRRSLQRPRLIRWPSNLGISTISSLMAYVLVPIASIDVTLWAIDQQWGLFNNIDLPISLEIILTFIMLDLLIYFQHRIFHKVPILWRIHKMHHTDIDLDVTSGSRFHPIEIVLSLGIKLVAILLMGASIVGMIAFEIILNATSMFNHSNIKIHPKIDRLLRWFVVTPDMHKVHHSIKAKETNSNFGFNLPFWDRIFKTYKFRPVNEIQTMDLGIKEFREPKYSELHWLLIIPFLKSTQENNSNIEVKEA